LVPLARGPDREAVPPRARARLYLPARLPGLRVRKRARAPSLAAAADPSRAGRARGEPARRVGASARSGEDRRGGGLMAAVDWFAQAEVAEPAPSPRRSTRRAGQRPATAVRSRRKPAQRRVRAHIVWMILFALLLAGVVAVNVAVLRAHVAVSRLDQKRAQLQARNQALASELSAASSAPRIERAARELGLVQASVGNTSYTDLTSPRR